MTMKTPMDDNINIYWDRYNINITEMPYICMFKKNISFIKTIWRWGVSIPLPLACEANALPSELHPLPSFISLLSLLPCLLILFRKNASGGVRTHASLDSRSWDGPLRPLGHECFSILLFYPDSRVHYSPSFLWKMHPVGFEPTHLSIAELKSAPLDHSGTNASYTIPFVF